MAGLFGAVKERAGIYEVGAHKPLREIRIERKYLWKENELVVVGFLDPAFVEGQIGDLKGFEIEYNRTRYKEFGYCEIHAAESDLGIPAIAVFQI